MARDSRRKKRDLGKSADTSASEVPSPAHLEAVYSELEQSQTSVEQPKRMSFTELAEELTRRSNL